eukprot:gene7213-7282_t
MANRVKQIHSFGQSIWLDFIDRAIISSGNLQKLIDEDGIRGVTSNPAIFEKAITSSSDYDADIRTLSDSDKTNEEIFFGLAISDIQNAAKLFEGVYNEGVVGADGYVSLEVSPFLALDDEGTTKQAEELWKAVDRKNVMIKIPGTKPGLSAIRKSIAKGININVTLLFGLPRYEEVTEAYISGLEDHLAAGHSIGHISSVASFFLSRIDVLIDPLLDEKGLGDLKGEVAIASAKKAYEIYKRVFSGPRWEKLAAQGAKPQRLLWASTSSKNPAFKDTKYVEALIGADTVDTVPLETIEAFRDHGIAADTLEQGLDKATEILDRVKAAGIDLDKITQQLEDEGIDKFNKPFEKLLKAIEDQKIKFLFFDIGGVLLTNGWGHESREEAAKRFGLDYSEVKELHTFIFNVYEAHGVDLDEYLDTVVFNHPRDFTREDFKNFMFEQSKELPNTLAWLKEWKKDCGFKIIAINNEGKELNDYRVKKFKLHDLFDAFVSSCEVGIRKPDPAIFKLAMGIAMAQPQECVYFDDRKMFALAAAKLGMQAYQHTSFEATKKILEKLKQENQPPKK